MLEQAQDCSIYIPTDEEASKYYLEIPYEGPSEGDHNGWGGHLSTYERTPEIRKEISERMKKVNSENDYWKKGIEAAKGKVKGQPQSKEHKANKAKSKSRAVTIEGITYKSQKDAANILGYSTAAISTWVKKQGRSNISIPKGSNQYTKRRVYG